MIIRHSLLWSSWVPTVFPSNSTLIASFMKNAFKGTLAFAALLAVAGATNADASPIYGYATLGLNLVTLSGIPLTNSSVTSTTSANYPGFASTFNQAVADPLQASSGPGAFPAENTFSQALLPANVSSPAGTRSDAQATGSISNLGSATFASEGKLVTAGSAGSSSGTNTIINVTPASSTTLNLTFDASANLSAIVQSTGDSAVASTNFNFDIFDVTTSSFVTITDNINAANSGNFIAPLALNQSVTANTSGTPRSFTSSLTAYSYSAELSPGDVYRVVLTDGTSETLSSATPEPSTWIMLMAGFVLLLALRRQPLTQSVPMSRH